MSNGVNTEKILKYIIWAGLIGIPFIPLIVGSGYYFPYIVPKTLAFKIITEIIWLAFLGLAALKKEYRPKLNLVLFLFFLYLLTVFISSILNGAFYFSFWGNNERSEGLLLLLHLFLYLFVLSGFLRKTKDWLIIFEASFLSGILVSLFGLGQYLEIGWMLQSAGGARITSTIGNAGYVAGYLIFNIFFGLILFFFRKNKYLRWYYILGILLQIFIVLNTLTRGGILALAFSLFIFIFYLTFFYLRSNKLIRNAGLAVLLSGIIFTALVFSNKEANWVGKSDILRRVSNISFSDATAENRLVTWNSSWQGFKEKPILGYGYENFYQVFDKYFNPKIYRHAGSVVWFDRAHNMIFDRLITGGIIGLSLYLSLLLAPLVYLWGHFLSKDNLGTKPPNVFGGLVPKSLLPPIILSLIVIAYFIQNLFIFESLVTYIPLFLVLGYLSQFCPKWPGKFFQSKKPYLVLLVIGVLVFLPALFGFNIKPALANRALIEAMTKVQLKKYEEAYNQFIDILDKDTLGNQEYRQHFAEFITGAVGRPDIDGAWVNQGVIRVEQEFIKQINEKPLSARNYLMFMRFLNMTYNLNPERLNKALALAEKAAKISPTRPQIYYEAGYSQFYLGKYYSEIGEKEKARQLYLRSIDSMQKAIDINDRVVESYFNMLMILFAVGKSDQVQAHLDKMDGLGLNYHNEEGLARMANSAVKAEQYQWTFKFYKELTEIVPEKPEHWVNLALSYAYLGQREKAVETAKKAGEFGGDFAKQSEAFIKDVLAGKFEK